MAQPTYCLAFAPFHHAPLLPQNVARQTTDPKNSQVKAFKFLRERGAAAKAGEAMLSLKSKAAILSRRQPIAEDPSWAAAPAAAGGAPLARAAPVLASTPGGEEGASPAGVGPARQRAATVSFSPEVVKICSPPELLASGPAGGKSLLCACSTSNAAGWIGKFRPPCFGGPVLDPCPDSGRRTKELPCGRRRRLEYWRRSLRSFLRGVRPPVKPAPSHGNGRSGGQRPRCRLWAFAFARCILPRSSTSFVS